MFLYFKRMCFIFLCLLAFYAHGDEKSEIRQMYREYEEAVSSHDLSKMLSFWSADATYTNSLTGLTLQGKEELRNEFKNWFETSKVDKVHFTINEIAVLSPDKAIEKGLVRITFKDGSPPLQLAFRSLLIKDGKQWDFQEVKQIDLGEMQSNYEKLKGLSWLEGDWIDTDENVTIDTRNQWSKSKNFLIQHYKVQLFEQEAMQGVQIIGWDPIEKRIRSWSFDSDGGFGQSSWEQRKDNWVVKASYTSANGSRASAVHIYSDITPDSYSWSSIGRDVDGAILPNIEPIKIIRKGSDQHE